MPGESYGQRSLTGYSPWSLKRVEHNLAKQNTIRKNKIQRKGLCVLSGEHRRRQKEVFTDEGFKE